MANGILQLSSFRQPSQDASALDKQVLRSEELLKGSQANVATEQARLQEELASMFQAGGTTPSQQGSNIGRSLVNIFAGKSKEEREEKLAGFVDAKKKAEAHYQQNQKLAESKKVLNDLTLENDHRLLNLQTAYDNNGGVITEAMRNEYGSIIADPRFRKAMFEGAGHTVTGGNLEVINGRLQSNLSLANSDRNASEFYPLTLQMSDKGAGYTDMRKNTAAADSAAVGAEQSALELGLDKKFAEDERAASLRSEKAAGDKLTAETRQMQGAAKSNELIANALSEFTGSEVAPFEVEQISKVNTPAYQEELKNLNTIARTSRLAIPQLENLKQVFELNIKEGKDLTGSLADFKSGIARILDAGGFEIDQDMLSDKTQVSIQAIDDALARLQQVGGSDTERELLEMMKASVGTAKTERENLDIIERTMQKLERNVQSPSAFLQATRSRPALLELGLAALDELVTAPLDTRRIREATPRQSTSPFNPSAIQDELKRRGLK